jgi:hypothetical protein
MKHIIYYFIFTVIILSCQSNSKSNQKPDIRSKSTVQAWNIMTINSIRKNLKESAEPVPRGKYENILMAFKISNGIDGTAIGNSNSARSLFIDKLKQNKENVDTFYIVETVTSGERIEIRNIVIYPLTSGGCKINIYDYLQGSWNLISRLDNIPISPPKVLQIPPAIYGTGYNNDPIIITAFVNNKISTSNYYLYYTLPNIWTDFFSSAGVPVLMRPRPPARTATGASPI